MNLALSQGASAAVVGLTRPLLRQTCATSGVTGISLTKLDVLDGFETLKICVGYELDGQKSGLSANGGRCHKRAAHRSMKKLPGWSESSEGARSWAAFACTARSNMCAASKS